MGRFVVATRDLSPGEVIIEEYPVTAGPRQFTPAVCLGCNVEVDGAKFCASCCWPMCGKDECESGPLHQLECPVLSGCKIKPKFDPATAKQASLNFTFGCAFLAGHVFAKMSFSRAVCSWHLLSEEGFFVWLKKNSFAESHLRVRHAPQMSSNQGSCSTKLGRRHGLGTAHGAQVNSKALDHGTKEALSFFSFQKEGVVFRSQSDKHGEIRQEIHAKSGAFFRRRNQLRD